jgi:hypothetical protein
MARQKKKDIVGGYETWGDDVTTTKLRKNAKFNYKYVELAANLVASGHSEEDLAFVFGVATPTVKSWKKRYPQFARACANGRTLAKNHAVANGLRTAAGYDYEEVQEEYLRKPVEQEDGSIKDEMVLAKRKVSKKHVPANPTLNMFYVCNMDPTFTSLKSVQIDAGATGVGGIRLTGDDMASGIKKLCQGLFEAKDELKDAKSKKVEAITVNATPVEADFHGIDNGGKGDTEVITPEPNTTQSKIPDLFDE